VAVSNKTGIAEVAANAYALIQENVQRVEGMAPPGRATMVPPAEG
jgi:hypothetical protein